MGSTELIANLFGMTQTEEKWGGNSRWQHVGKV